MVLETSAALKIEAEEEDAYEDKGLQLFFTCLKAVVWDTTELRLGKRLRLCIIIMMLQEMSGLNIVSLMTYIPPLSLINIFRLWDIRHHFLLLTWVSAL